jgi:hypothetical protein
VRRQDHTHKHMKFMQVGQIVWADEGAGYVPHTKFVLNDVEEEQKGTNSLLP